MLTLAALVIVSGGCATTYRLKQDFNSESIGAVPLNSPPPNPPADTLTWGQQFLQPTVVARAGGGRWVRIVAKESYFPRNFAGALTAFTDFFKVPSANVRGHFSVRLTGIGHVVIAIHAAQGPSGTQVVPLGGLSIRSGPFNSADLGSLTDADLSLNREPFGIGLASYKPGDTLEIFWSIDQASHVLNLSVSPGDSRQLSFALSQNGVTKTPLRRIFLAIDVYDFTRSTALFVDDVTVEEF